MEYLIDVKEEKACDDKDKYIKILYEDIKKIFLDNGYFYKKNNKYINPKPIYIFKINKNIALYESYKIQIIEIKNKFYVSIAPYLMILSSNAADKSSISSTYTINIKSGNSFIVEEFLNNKLTIRLKKGYTKQVNYPENYYFNFSSEESEKLGINKERSEFKKEYNVKKYVEIKNKLKILEKIIDFDNTFIPEIKIKNEITYQFEKKSSQEVKDILNLSSASKF